MPATSSSGHGGSLASSRRPWKTRWRKHWRGIESPGPRIPATPTAPGRSPLPEARDVLARRLRRQAAWCAELGSPLYSSLLESAADDLQLEGPVWGVLAGFEEEQGGAALALRLMGAVHRLVLDDTLPELARHYPSTGGGGDAGAAWAVVRQALVDH